MTFNDLWSSLERKRPLLADDSAKVEITSLNLKILLRQAYEKGQESVPKPENKGESFGSIFRGM